MGIHATVVIKNASKSVILGLIAPDELFTTELKKGIRKYWGQSGVFPEEQWEILSNSDLLEDFVVNPEMRPSQTYVSLGFTIVPLTED
tara:strand:- start:18532 stop:18795 length:264 start_codon:yes stop_codon:yes gene_type:complete